MALQADRIEYVDGPGDIKFSVEGAAPVHNIVTMTLSVHLNRRKDEGALDLGSVVTLSVAKGSVTSQISSPAVGATRH